MELTKNIVRQLIADSERAIFEGTSIIDWHQGRIDLCTFLLTTFDISEGN